MTQHLNEIQFYRMLLESEVKQEDDSLLLDEVASELSLDKASVLLEDLGDVIFKLKSYRETGSSEEYSLGVEEGLQLAADMLTRLIESHSG